MTKHYLRKDKRGRRYALADNLDGTTNRVYLKKCKNCKVYKIPSSAKRDLCFKCEREGKAKEK
jgi:hypothetical protein